MNSFIANTLKGAAVLAAALLVFVPHSAEAQPTIDGQTTDPTYIPLGTSPAEPGGGFTGGIVGLHAYAGPDSLYVAVEGQVHNGQSSDIATRDIVVLINSSSVDGINTGTPLPAGDNNGSPFYYIDDMTMDLEVDYGVRLTGDQENTWAFASLADYAGYVAGDSTNAGEVKDIGDTILKSLDGTPKTGNAPGTYAYDDTSDVSTVDGTGFEFSVPHDWLGTSQGDEFQLFAIYTNFQDSDANAVSATLIPDDGETTQYSGSEDWTAVGGTQATGAQVLPVELASFDARRDGANAVLNWTTASETGNAGFAVQHAVGSGDFERIGWVDGHGTTTEAQSYRFVAEEMEAGTHRFRLEQEDLDGSATLSEPVEVTVRPQGPIAIQKVAPNPVRETGTLRFTARESGDVTVALYDVLGRQVKALHQGRVSGGQAQQVRFDASSLSSGVYFLRVEGDGFSRTERLTVAR